MKKTLSPYEETARRHQEVYATKNLPPFNYDQVTERLFAGRNPLTAQDVHMLAELGITHVLDLRESHEWAAPKFGAEAIEEIKNTEIKRLNLVVKDLGAPTLSDMDAAWDFIEQALANPSALIYVHCRAGMERTAAILIGCYARQQGLNYETAFSELKARRPIFQPLPNQEHATREWIAQQTKRKDFL